jgi:uncharacterized repeat protein (TIGR01451 family)
VRLSKSTTTLTVAPGTAIPYTITVANNSSTVAQPASYTFTEVVPANTTYTNFAAVAPATATISGCTSGDPAGQRCTITVTSPIPAGTSVQVTFTVTADATLPTSVASIVNQAYYDTPGSCLLSATPVCNPVQPACTGTTCTPPTACVAGDPACVTVPQISGTVGGVGAQSVPVNAGWMLATLALFLTLGARGLPVHGRMKRQG